MTSVTVMEGKVCPHAVFDRRTRLTQAHKVFKGAEALGLMQSRAGVTSESLAHLREALSLVVNENAASDPYSMEQVSVFPDHTPLACWRHEPPSGVDTRRFSTMSF